MATESTFVWDASFQAAADLSSNQFCIVKSTGAGLASLCTGSSMGVAGPLGVLQNAPTSNHAASVRLLGRTKLSASAAIAIGDWVTSSTGGQGVTATSTGEKVIGVAVTASTAAGQLIDIFMFGPQGFEA